MTGLTNVRVTVYRQKQRRLRFHLWNLGVKVCDTRFSKPWRWVSNIHVGRFYPPLVWRLYPCGWLHPQRLIEGYHYSDREWAAWGWKKPRR